MASNKNDILEALSGILGNVDINQITSIFSALRPSGNNTSITANALGNMDLGKLSSMLANIDFGKLLNRKKKSSSFPSFTNSNNSYNNTNEYAFNGFNGFNGLGDIQALLAGLTRPIEELRKFRF